MQLSQYFQTYYYPLLSATALQAASDSIAGAFSLEAKQKKPNISFEISEKGGIYYLNEPKLHTKGNNIPQNEAEARERAHQALQQLNENLSMHLTPEQRKEIPYLFVKPFLRYESASPIHDPHDKDIHYWKVNFALEMTVLGERRDIETPLSAMQDIRPQPLDSLSSTTLTQPNARAKGGAIGSDGNSDTTHEDLYDFYQKYTKAIAKGKILSVLIGENGEMAGLSSNFCPPLNGKATPLYALAEGFDPMTSLIFNQNEVLECYAASFLGASGEIVACKESASFQNWHLSAEKDTANGYNNKDKDPFITITNIKAPKDKQHGTAKITIKRTFKVVTSGIGCVKLPDIINKTEFENVFKDERSSPLYFKYLPLDKDTICQLCTPKEREQIEKKDKTFWEYYKTDVVYDIQIEIPQKNDKNTFFSLWDWHTLNPMTTGIVSVIFWEGVEGMDKYCQIWKDLKKAENAGNKELVREGDKAKSEVVASLRAQAFIQTIGADKEKYKNKNIYITSQCYDSIKDNMDANKILTELDSIAICDAKYSIKGKEQVKLMGELTSKLNLPGSLLPFYENFVFRSLNPNPQFNTLSTYAFGQVKANIIHLHPSVFAPIGTVFPHIPAIELLSLPGGASVNEILAHEAGHTFATAFVHSSKEEGNYEYSQEGLQSNLHLHIFPSAGNTEGILLDAENLKSINIASVKQ